jgi:hypothetical protein
MTGYPLIRQAERASPCRTASDAGEGGFDCLAFRLTDPGPKQQRLNVPPRLAERIVPLTEKPPVG